jgi:hypothetical protein
VRAYEERDRDACRALYRGLTQWHRDLLMYLEEPKYWPVRERVAGRGFRA